MTASEARLTSASARPAAAHRAAVAMLVTVYALLLAGVYEFIVSPRFEYLGFVSVSPDPLFVMLAALLCGVLALFLPRDVARPSDLGRIVVFFLVTVPAVVIPTFLSEQWEGAVIEAQTYAVVAFLVLTGVLAALPRGAVPPLRLPGDLALYILLALAVVVVFVLASSYGFSIQIHALTDVYDQREIYSEGGGGSGIVGFAAGLLQNVLAPIFLVVGMHRRSVVYLALGLVLLLYIYTITGLKSALIGVAFVIGIYWLAHLAKAAAFTRAWSAVAIAFVSVAWLVSSVPVLSIAIDLVVRRIFMMQGMLAYNYIEIFGREEPTYFSHTILRSFFQRPFQGSPPEIVGDLLFGRSVHANASFVTDGYVSGKLLGVLIAAVVVALFLALLDALSSGLESPVVLAATCMAIYMTTQSGVVTALLNHGGVALVACLWLAGSALAVQPPDQTAPRRRGGDRHLARVDWIPRQQVDEPASTVHDQAAHYEPQNRLDDTWWDDLAEQAAWPADPTPPASLPQAAAPTTTVPTRTLHVPAPPGWYRSRPGAVALIVAAAAAAAVLLVIAFWPNDGSPDEPTGITPPSSSQPTPATTEPHTIPSTRADAPPAPPPPLPPAPVPTNPAPAVPRQNWPRQPAPSSTPKPEIGVTRTPVTRAPISVAPKPRTPAETATPGENSRRGGWPW